METFLLLFAIRFRYFRKYSWSYPQRGWLNLGFVICWYAFTQKAFYSDFGGVTDQGHLTEKLMDKLQNFRYCPWTKYRLNNQSNQSCCCCWCSIVCHSTEFEVVNWKLLLHSFFVSITFISIYRLKFFKMSTWTRHNFRLENRKALSETDKNL